METTKRKRKMRLWLICGIAAVLIVISYLNYRHFVPNPVSVGEKTYEVESRVLEVPMKGRTLYGELLLPKGETGPLPTVICSHGFGSSGQQFTTGVGMSLAKSGFAVYCFDFYGGGSNSKSGGSMTEMSVFTEQDDLNAVVDAVLALDTTDTDNLFLLGESQGGFVSAITAAQRQEDIRGMILFYPALCIADDARARYATQEEVPETYKIMGKTVGRIYSQGLYDYDVDAHIAPYTGPVLILHGDKDTVVNLSYSQHAESVYEDAELIVMPGQGHGFTGKTKTEAARLTYDFILQTIGQ